MLRHFVTSALYHCWVLFCVSRVLGAGRQLAKFMELQSLNDLGYPKRYIRTLQVLFSCSCYSYFCIWSLMIVSHCEWQISEVVKSMKDLMNFTGDHKLGPIGKSTIPFYNILLAWDPKQGGLSGVALTWTILPQFHFISFKVFSHLLRIYS